MSMMALDGRSLDRAETGDKISIIGTLRVLLRSWLVTFGAGQKISRRGLKP
jgi:hypothetical protein